VTKLKKQVLNTN